ncbi:MAG: hypothetical protein C0504_07485 [Candidatus Solibacter sp.]|nr:hypothetical protein [Candidatus Solibacter sp.]
MLKHLHFALLPALVLAPPAGAAGDAADRAAAERNVPAAAEPLALQPACTFTLSTSEVLAPRSGSQGTIQVDTQPGCLWSVAWSRDWFVVEQPASLFGEGSGSVTFRVEANPGAARTTSIALGPALVRISQPGVSPGPVAAFRDVWGGVRLSRYGSDALLNGGGAFDSNPAAALSPNGDVYLACRDLWNAIWASVYRTSTKSWESWRFGGGLTAGQPSIAVAASGTAYIAVRDAWNSYWVLTYNGSSFGAWMPLRGVFATDPVIAAAGDGSVYVIGKDNWNGLWSGRISAAGAFQGWRFGGGIVKGSPSVAGGADGSAYVAARDPWDAVWIARVSGETWLSWSNGGGILSLDPQIASGSPGRVHAVVRDPWGGWWTRGFTEGSSHGWLAWASTGGSLVNASPMATAGGVFIAGLDAAGAFWWHGQDAGAWTRMGWAGTAAGTPAASR